MKEEKIRTQLQNKSIHLWFQMVADELNSAGYTQKMALQGLELDNTEESIKSLFRSVGMTKFGVKSTASLTTKQVMEIYEELNRHFASMGVHVPFPSSEYNYLNN